MAAGEIERFVVDQIHQIGTDPQLITETIRQVRLQSEDGITHLTEERTSLQQQLRSNHADLQATASLPNTTKRVSQLADLQDQLRTTERRLTEIDSELAALRANQINEREVTHLLANFHQTWEPLAPRDQSRVLELLIERIDYRGQDGPDLPHIPPERHPDSHPGNRRMNTALTITREFHTTRRRDGQQHLRPGAAPETPKGKIPRISRLMALAIHCDELLRPGQITNQSELARYAQITRARTTQILTLLNLAPDIQEEILFLPRTTGGRGEIQEKDIRKIAMELDWRSQREMWRVLRESATAAQQ